MGDRLLMISTNNNTTAGIELSANYARDLVSLALTFAAAFKDASRWELHYNASRGGADVVLQGPKVQQLTPEYRVTVTYSVDHNDDTRSMALEEIPHEVMALVIVKPGESVGSILNVHGTNLKTVPVAIKYEQQSKYGLRVGGLDVYSYLHGNDVLALYSILTQLRNVKGLAAYVGEGKFLTVVRTSSMSGPHYVDFKTHFKAAVDCEPYVDGEVIADDRCPALVAGISSYAGELFKVPQRSDDRSYSSASTSPLTFAPPMRPMRA